MTLSDHEILADVLASQKAIAQRYGVLADDCATAVVRNEFLSLLNEEHRLHNVIFDEMSNRKLLVTETANQEKLQQIKQKYSRLIGQ